ncbi:hypothetical protein DLREEDagr8_33530 [Dongia sp. agr-C8]
MAVALVLSNAAAQDKAAFVDHCRVAPNRADALDNPNKHAWDLFQVLMHPALPKEASRGEPDCSKPLGAPGTTSVWETWRLARTEVFLEDGSFPPSWDDLSLPSGFLGATPDTTTPGESPGHSIVVAKLMDRRNGSLGPLFDPETDQSIFTNRGGIGETRMNRSTYEFIRANCLHSLDGLKRYASAVKNGSRPPIRFPDDSIEVKAVWLEFAPDALANGVRDRYYSIEHEGKVYGLTSFHVLTKDVPDWFWATFHHVDAPPNEFERKDTYGRPLALETTVWKYYVLGGTQISFIEPNLKPNILSDHYIEFGFQRSSCITCHAMAHGTAEGVNGQDFDDPTGPIQTIDVGVPSPSPFDSAEHFYIQTDFLWSIPFRARAEKAAPPNHCKF